MGEGVTNPVRGAASSSAAVVDPVSSLLLHVDSSTSIQLIVLITVVSAIALRWILRGRKVHINLEDTHLPHGITPNDIAGSDQGNTVCIPADVVKKHYTCFDIDVLRSDVTKCPYTGFTSESEPHLRRSFAVCQTAYSLDNLSTCTQPLTLIPLFSVSRCAARRVPAILRMDSSKDIPTLPDPQPDSFFTWDSGGSSGEYSFVHTAVELPKYPDGAISEEERQMLLLYMQTGHPELLLTSSSPSGHQTGGVQMSENLLCDPTRGFLETIVEENSDDLRSPSECDETSLGWGSWDESDEDRLTVVEMVTSTSEDLVFQESEQGGTTANNLSDLEKLQLSTEESVSPERGGENVNKKQLFEHRDKVIPSLVLSGVTSGNNSTRSVSTHVNNNQLDNKTSLSQKCEKNVQDTTIRNKLSKLDSNSELVVSSNLNSFSTNGSFDNLWISSNTLDSPSETTNPWSTISNNFNEYDEDINALTSLDVSNPEQIIEGVNPLLILGKDDICLVPSSFNHSVANENPENLMFSDNFKDYFLPAESYTPSFCKNVPDLLADFPKEDYDPSKEEPMRCLRIEYGPTITEQRSIPCFDAYQPGIDVDKLNDFINTPVNRFLVEKSSNRVEYRESGITKMGTLKSDLDESQNEEYSVQRNSSFNTEPETNEFDIEKHTELEVKNNNLQEAMFSPLDGDIVYGSTWASSRGLKEPEKNPLGTEVHCSAAQTDVRRESTMLSDSPPPDSNRPASDDDMTEVPNSLSRWRHHTDLQHLQEGTSPITRWHHHSNLLFSPEESKQTTDSDESDDGLPPQLKEIYSSFKMRDNKMGRIRIKEDKNNNFKRLGLWEKESKVTLPPFNLAQAECTSNSILKQKESNGVGKELDDLEFDMFAVTENLSSKINLKTAASGDSDIDDALKSFNHLDDYSSESEDNSDSEDCYVVNFRDKMDNDMPEILEVPEADSNASSIEDSQLTSKTEMLSLENPCSDNSDNCPLCTDPSFKNSHINDLFSLQNNEIIVKDVQSLLQNTYPKMIRLSQFNLSDAEIIESNGESNKTGDSISPITTSDSDEGVRVKEVKKRVKKRSKENSNSELKHDDSGYVEEDEDETDDSLGENSKKHSSSSQSLNTDQTRKSLSTVYYESKSHKVENAGENLHLYPIPESFQEFSKQLDLSLSNEEIKAGFFKEEKWNIPENLSEFSAWLLDKELQKINSRDELEKLLVDDIISLREQTITKFLKNSSSSDEKSNLNSLDLPGCSNVSVSVDNVNSQKSNIEGQSFEKLGSKSSDVAENENGSSNNFEKETKRSKIEVNCNEYEDKFSKNNQGSENELPKEYYTYNINTQVSKIFEANANNAQNETVDISTEQSESNFNQNTKNLDNVVFTTSKSRTEICEQSLMVEESNETKLQISNIDAEITHHLPSSTTTCHNKHNSEYNSEHNLCTEASGVKPPENTTQQSNPLHPSVTYVPAEHTREIQLKVNDTTIQKSLTEEEKALPEVVNSTQVSIPTRDVNSDDSTDGGKEVATSIEEKYSFSDRGSELEDYDRDLMTQGVPADDENVSVGTGADVISSPEAAVVSADLDPETHVHFDSCHAYPPTSLDSDPTDRLDNSNLHYSGEADIAPEVSNNAFGNCQHSVLSDSETILDSDKVESGSKEVDCLPVAISSLPAHEEDLVKEHKGFTTVDSAVTPDSPVVLTDAASNDERNSLLDCSISNAEVGGLCLYNDLELFVSEKVPAVQLINSTVQLDKQNRYLIEVENKLEVDSNLKTKQILDLTASDSVTKDQELVSHKTKSEIFESEIPVFRAEYKRSNSLGRNSSEADETFELYSGQSKSTPDLSRCHEQQKKSNPPLSVRLSKSVSQRIEDYLGRNSRDSRLSKSLPPNERSRHYRRICVSTETVVEKAARFEARSKSAVREKVPEDKSYIKNRSGSCPPSNMRSNTSWISDRTYRSYNKPTATVRPTIDAHRNGTNHKKDLNEESKNEKENLFELITGYSKATKVTHKPPVPPSTNNLQQSLKSVRLKGKIANARKDFFERLSQNDLTEVPKRDDNLEDDDETSSGLRRFDEFRRSAREERARLAASHPDLGALEAAVRSSKRKIDQLKKRNRTKSSQQSSLDAGPTMPSTTKDLCLPYRRATGEIAWASCAKRVAAARSKGRAHEQLEIVDQQRAFSTEKTAGVRAHDHPADPAIADGGSGGGENCGEFLGSRARSMDFLLDADNRERAQPPENRLGATGGQARVKSEHELRIERSLQNLTVPDWYKQSAWSKKPTEGFILRRGSEGSAGESRKRWQGFSSSRTPSTTSLNPPSMGYSSQRSIVVPKRVTAASSSGDWRYVGSLVSSRESLTPASPASLSPRECSSSAAFQYGLSSSLSRWSSSRLSTSSAPLTTLNVHRSFRQPYLGWRAAAASSSGSSPVNATTPVMQGSRPESPRRGSQDQHYVYGLQQNQITSAATLRPDSAEQPSDSNRISPLALHTTNIFFSNDPQQPPFDQQKQKFGPELRRDRYSYTQSLYSGTVIVSPLDDPLNIYEEEDPTPDNRFRIVSSPQPPPRIWMESSFVGTKKGEQGGPPPTGRTIRIVPSDAAVVRPGSDGRFGTVPGSSSVRGGTCATQTAMDTRELIDHLHNFLRGLQNRNQMLRPSSNSAFTPVPSNSACSQHDEEEDDGLQSAASLQQVNGDQRPNLVDYDSEPKAYPRVSWRKSSSSSKDMSPDNSSTDNEMWLSVGEDMVGPHKGFRTTPERHMDGSSRSSVSPPSPPLRYPKPQKRVSEDSTGSQKAIFFASSRRGSKGSIPDNNRNENSAFLQQHSHQTSPSSTDALPVSRDEVSRKSSSVHSEESGVIRRDSRSGGSNSWRDSKTDQDSSSATTSRGDKESKSSASMEEVLESLLAIPPTSSRSSSPTSPRRSKGPSYYQSHHRYAPRLSQEIHSTPDAVFQQKSNQLNMDQITRPAEMMLSGASYSHHQQVPEDGDEENDDHQGKMFDGSFSFPQPYPSSNSSAKQLPISSPLGEVNHGSFCRSSSTSPLEDDVQSPTSMEVLVPEGEEQDLSSIIEDETKLTEEYENHPDLQGPTHSPLIHDCPHYRPPLQRQPTLPSCSSTVDILPALDPPQEAMCGANLFAGLQQGSYSRGVAAEGALRRPQSLCLVLLHLPCMFCARALAPPPTTHSFSDPTTRHSICVSEPSTPSSRGELMCPSEPCWGGQPPSRCVFDTDTNLGSNPGRGPSTTTEEQQQQGASSTTPTRKKKASSMIATTEGHLKCHRPKCSKSLPIEEARAKFRTCPNCYTYYCSRQCRKLHLARHKDHCPQTRISNLCKQVLMKARDDPVSRRHLSLCARRGLLSRGRGAVKLLFLSPEDAQDYLIHGWESAKGQTLYVSRADLLPQEMGSDVFSQVRSFCDKYNPERKFILLAAITVTNEIAAALEREVVVRGAKMHLSPSLPEDDVQTLILTITKTDPETGDPALTTSEERRCGLNVVEEQLSSRGVDLEKLYPHTYRKLLKYVDENEPFTPISIFPTDQRNGRVFMCIILPWADPDIIVNISSKVGAATGKSSKKKWIS